MNIFCPQLRVINNFFNITKCKKVNFKIVSTNLPLFWLIFQSKCFLCIVKIWLIQKRSLIDNIRDVLFYICINISCSEVVLLITNLIDFIVYCRVSENSAFCKVFLILLYPYYRNFISRSF